MEFLALSILFLIGCLVIGFKELKTKIELYKIEKREERIKNRRIRERYDRR